jgi:hypothetical protein
MAIQVELDPKTEARLAAEAQAHGLPLGEYAQRLIQQAIDSMPTGRSRSSQDEFKSFLDRLASRAPNVPQLRAETFSREMIYGEHD